MPEKFRISRAAELGSLAVLRDFIAQVCVRAGIDDDTCYDLKLAVDEASTNVITHGYKGMNPGSIILDMQLDPEQVTMMLTDFGHAFEPSPPPARDLEMALEDRPEGGLGLFFIYSTMDSVDYHTTEEGNRLILVKKLKPAPRRVLQGERSENDQ